ncbi:hypothetical protein HMPREF9296_0424 [Prevotella disiens FB035-09AN]|uniref:Uncharacterized protein n=1 Tax=Prevotella disiens FB035-09AN TaxID=866771 RepID=E1KQ17_9BACT|nr:hypothetical protein HMPREF9296_0424 [Prevotella disiens FB035-09AN]
MLVARNRTLEKNNLVKPHEACKRNAFCEVNINRYKQM